MKIVFIICNIDIIKHKKGGIVPRWESTYREGVASIAAYLRKDGHEVSLLKLSSGVDASRFTEIWSRDLSDYDIAAFTVNTIDVPEVSRLAGIIKSINPEIHTTCGGAHPTLVPESMINDPSFDSVCRGEGEIPMAELCQAIQCRGDLSKIEGLWVIQNQQIVKNQPRKLITDLSELPPPARDIPTYSDFDQTQIKDKAFFMGTRGCPYTCTYCCNKSIRNIYCNPSAYYRFKPVDMIIGEIKEYLQQDPKALWIALYDDVMMGNKKWFSEFCHSYSTEIKKGTFLTGRWEMLDEENIRLLRKISCRFMLVGVEIGDEDIRKQVLSRKQSDKLMMDRSKILKKNRILFGLYTMVGVPEEDLPKALKTVKLSAQLTNNPLPGHHTIFYPFEGTPLHRKCLEDGILSERHVDSYFNDSKLDMDYFPREQILWAHRNFRKFLLLYWMTFHLPSIVSKPIVKVLDYFWLNNKTASLTKNLNTSPPPTP